jgi:hypothetical protein
MKDACKVLVGVPEGRRPVGSLRRIWEDNIRIDLRQMEWKGVGGLDASGSE